MGRWSGLVCQIGPAAIFAATGFGLLAAPYLTLPENNMHNQMIAIVIEIFLAVIFN